MSSIPPTMRALAIDKFTKPENYGLATLPTPQITEQDEILIKVHSASVNPVDVKFANGLASGARGTITFPYKIGYDVAGEVAAVGSSVTQVNVGDHVLARVPDKYRGTLAEYVLSSVSAIAKKPDSVSFSEAASLPLAGLTAYQALQTAEKALGGLKGKTIYVPGGLSGTGGFAIQWAKSLFGAGKVITTLSTAKIPLLPQFIGDGVVDQVIDYTKDDPLKVIERASVDVMFDTMATASASVSLLKPGGFVVSVSGVPSGTLLKRDFMPSAPTWMVWAANIMSWLYTRKFTSSGVGYTYIFVRPIGSDLQKLVDLIAEGGAKALVGSTAKLEDIDAVRKGCDQIFLAKGGVGKFVVEVV